MRNKRLEYVTASIFLSVIVGAWLLGFRIHFFHTVMSGAFVVLVGTFPFWIIGE